jgi:hypothetical protein
MARSNARRRHADPADPRLNGEEMWLRRIWLTAMLLALVPAVFVVPIQFAEAHLTQLAQQIELGGGDPYPVVEIRQKVELSRGSHAIEAQVATYRVDEETATVRLHGYDQSDVVREEEGWLVVPAGSGSALVYVTADGRDGFLARDYRAALEGEFDDLYVVANAWIVGWAGVGLITLTALSVQRSRRGATTPRRAALAPALYCAGAVALVGLAYGFSFSMAAAS